MRRLLVVIAAAALAAPLFGAARLTFNIKGSPVPIAWTPAQFPIAYQIDADAARALAGGSEAVGRSFQSWVDLSESSVRFRDTGVAARPAGKDGVNAVTINDELFANSGFLAFTTTWFDDSGTIEEADIQIDPTVAGDQTRVEALIEHEVGHLLGLDHSAVVSSAMYPFVADGVGRLDSDDRLAMAAMYPGAPEAAPGTLRGRVDGSAGPLFGAQVVALGTTGAPVASALTSQDGTFAIEVPAGSYKLYVEPLDGPVDPRNLSGVWRSADDSVFRTEFLQEQWLRVEAGELHDGLVVQAGAPATLNPKWIGVLPAGSRDVKLASTVATVRAGDTVSIAIGGDGFVGGMTQFRILGDGFSRISEFQYGPNYVWATFLVAPETPPGSFVLLAESGQEAATLTGALRVENGTNAGRRRPIGR